MPLRDLYIVTYAPKLGSGRAMRSFSCIKALAMLGPVDLAYVPHDGDEPSSEYRAIENLEFHQIKPSRGCRRALTYAGKRLQGIPAQCCRGTSPELIAEGERLAMSSERGRVVVDGGSAATALLPLARRRPVTYNSHNFESDRVGAGARWRAEMRRYERRVLTRVSESWLVSRSDIDSARALVPDAQLRYVPNVVDVSTIKRCNGERRGREDGGTVLMVADFRYGPNRSGLDLLAGHVLPRVWEQIPSTRVELVGRGLDQWAPPDPRIHVLGFVEEIGEVYEHSDCVVVPLVEGAGTPLKFVEALAYEVPVVATPFAAQGLEVVPGTHYREGADARSLAEAIVSVLRDRARATVAAGRRLAEDEYSIESLAERLASSAAR
jgi:glycosyltransferase involved in cell wall biosynthesis